MDNYISKKRGPDGRSLFRKVLPEENKEPAPDKYKIDAKTGRSLDPQYATRQVKHKEEYPTFGENGQGYEQMEEEYNRGPGFFERIVKIFRVSPSSSEEEDFSEEDMIGQVEEDEVKEVLRITVKWLKMLPPEDIDDIKDSEDFRRYKELLKKYNLIR